MLLYRQFEISEKLAALYFYKSGPSDGVHNMIEIYASTTIRMIETYKENIDAGIATIFIYK